MKTDRLSKIIFAFLSIFSFVWLLFRSGTKPSRLSYSCQKWAAANSLAFFGIVLPTSPSLLKWIKNQKRAKNFLPVLWLLIILPVMVFGIKIQKEWQSRAESSPIARNIGVLADSKVVWITNTQAAKGYAGKSWEERADQNVVQGMLDSAIMSLTDQSTVKDAWTTIFTIHNNGADYQNGEKIAFKINNNNECDQQPELQCPLVQTVRAMLDQLVNKKGIPPGDITVYDVSRGVPNYIQNMVKASFTGVNTGRGNDCSNQQVMGAGLANDLIKAKYLINMPLLRTHGQSGVTLSFKNHLGSTCEPSNFHGKFLEDSATTNSLVVLNNNDNIKSKTIAVIADGIYGGKNGGPYIDPDSSDGIKPYPNSLFLSTDPVAVDSVMIDYLQSIGASINQAGKDPRTYLKLAAGIGLGNHVNSCAGSGCLNFSGTNINLVKCTDTCTGAVVPTSPPGATSTPNPTASQPTATNSPQATATPQPTSPNQKHCLPLGDIDCSCEVNSLDFNYFIAKYNSADTKADLDDSGKVNSLDISILLSNFGKTCSNNATPTASQPTAGQPTAIPTISGATPTFPPTTGKTYYAATTGSDSNPGDETQPWKTIGNNIGKLAAGDTLLIRGGEYQNEQISIDSSKSGQENKPIQLRGHTGETAVLKNSSIALNGADWWIIANFEMTGTTNREAVVTINNKADHNTFRNLKLHHLFSYGISHMDGSFNTYENNTFDTLRPQTIPHHGDIHAIEIVNGDSNTVRNSYFKNIGADGVQLTWTCDAKLSNTLIENNEFLLVNAPDFPVPGCGENGIDVKCAQGGTVIRGNKIHGFRPTANTPNQCASGSPGEGIVIHENAKNVTVEKNIIWDNPYGIVAGGGAENIKVLNNIFGDNPFNDSYIADNDHWCKPSAFTTNGVTNVEIYHNTFVNNKWFLCGFGASNLKFKNNIIVNAENDNGLCSGSSCERSNNGWFTVSQPLTGSGDVSGSDPGFVNQTGKDYHLKLGSAAIDKGVNVGITTDFDGVSRPQGAGFDLGAFEFK